MFCPARTDGCSQKTGRHTRTGPSKRGNHGPQGGMWTPSRVFDLGGWLMPDPTKTKAVRDWVAVTLSGCPVSPRTPPIDKRTRTARSLPREIPFPPSLGARRGRSHDYALRASAGKRSQVRWELKSARCTGSPQTVPQFGKRILERNRGFWRVAR